MLPLLLAIGLVTLSIFVHELGHFLVARWRGLVVPRFSLFGIGKPIFAWKWKGVEFCVCWLPIGAYVMIPQLTAMDDFEGETPEEARNLPPADYLSKLLVALAGPAANILFALALGCVVWSVGMQVPTEFNRTEIGDVSREIRTSDGRSVISPAAAAGLRTGDTIRQIDGNQVSNFQDIISNIILGSKVDPQGRRVATITFERDGVTLTQSVFPELVGTEGLRAIGIAPRSDLIVDKVSADSAAAQAGLLPSDRILAVDGRALSRRDELREHFQKKHDEPSQLLLSREGRELTVLLKPRTQIIDGESLWLIGVTWRIETVTIHPTPLDQIGGAVGQVYHTLTSLLNRHSDIGVRHMSGLVGIVDNLQQVASFGLIPALAFLITINVSLALCNLLPIPVLDGGHVVFATLAKLRGRPLSPALMIKTFSACFFILIGLIIYISFHDIRRAIQSRSEISAEPAPAKTSAPGSNSPAPAP